MNDDTGAEEQFIDFKCPSCGDQNSFPATTAGSVCECVNCSAPLIVPASGDVGLPIPIPISTPRLVLRKFRGEDWKNLLELFSDDEFYQDAPVKLDSEEIIARWLEEDAVVKLTTPGVPYILAMQAQDSGKIIGCLSLLFTDAERLQSSIYLVIHRDFQRKGFGLETVSGILQFCFQGIPIHRVQARCDSGNAAACGLFAKAGMRREGEFIQDRKVGGAWANTAAYAILRDEFKPA